MIKIEGVLYILVVLIVDIVRRLVRKEKMRERMVELWREVVVLLKKEIRK